MTSNNSVQKIRSNKKRVAYTSNSSNQVVERRQSRQARQRNRDAMCYETTI